MGGNLSGGYHHRRAPLSEICPQYPKCSTSCTQVGLNGQASWLYQNAVGSKQVKMEFFPSHISQRWLRFGLNSHSAVSGLEAISTTQ
jgi:ferritin